jgi:hypothetical protein
MTALRRLEKAIDDSAPEPGAEEPFDISCRPNGHSHPSSARVTARS